MAMLWNRGTEPRSPWDRVKYMSVSSQTVQTLQISSPHTDFVGARRDLVSNKKGTVKFAEVDGCAVDLLQQIYKNQELFLNDCREV